MTHHLNDAFGSWLFLIYQAYRIADGQQKEILEAEFDDVLVAYTSICERLGVEQRHFTDERRGVWQSLQAGDLFGSTTSTADAS